jgi:hypothetical protein
VRATSAEGPNGILLRIVVESVSICAGYFKSIPISSRGGAWASIFGSRAPRGKSNRGCGLALKAPPAPQGWREIGRVRSSCSAFTAGGHDGRRPTVTTK